MPDHTAFSQGFRAAAEEAGRKSQGLVIYHHTGSAVVEATDRASLDADALRSRFRPKLGVLGRAFAITQRFLRGKLEARHLYVLDATIPADPGGTPLDHLLRPLGYEVNDRREVRGNRAHILRQFVLALVPLFAAGLRTIPEIRERFGQHPVAQWLDSYLIHSSAGLLVAVLIAAGVFAALEYNSNYLGLFKPKRELLDGDEEVGFIADEARARQRTPWAWLLIELPFVFVIVPLLGLLHAVALLRWPLQGVGLRRLADWLPRGSALRHFGWLFVDIALIGLFLAAGTHRFGGPAVAESFDRYAATLLAAVGFLGVGGVREAYKLLFRKDVSAETARHRPLLLVAVATQLAAVGTAGYLAVAAPFTWPVAPPLLSGGALLLLAMIRYRTQSLRWVLFRVAEVQRLGRDFRPLFDGLLKAVPRRLIAVGLWNVDEEPESPTGYQTLADLGDDAALDIDPRLQKLVGLKRWSKWPHENGASVVARYLVHVSRGVREPVRGFEATVRSVGQAGVLGLQQLTNALPIIAASRLRFLERTGPADDNMSWAGEFVKLQPAVEAGTGLKAEQAAEAIDTIRQWEEAAGRFRLEVLFRRKAREFPNYREHLLRLALFVYVNAEEALAFEQHRTHEARRAAREQSSFGVPVALCREAGLFADLSVERAGRLAEEFEREGFLRSSHPIVFDPAELAYLASGYLTPPLLYAEHDAMIRALTAAGAKDRRFLKVASEWARYVQNPDGGYFDRQIGVARPTEERIERFVHREARLALLARSLVLLLDYYEQLAVEGLAGVEPNRLRDELDNLGREHAGRAHLSITQRLEKLDAAVTAAEGGAGDRPTARALAHKYRNVWRTQRERWRRLQIRRLILAGRFADAAELLPPPRVIDAGYNAEAAHDTYFRGVLAATRGDTLTGLAQFDRAARLAHRHDDVLVAKVLGNAARALSALGAHAWASELLERLHERYGLYLRDDPFLIHLAVDKALADAHCLAGRPELTGKVVNRWLAPLLRRPSLPADARARLDLALAFAAEKQGGRIDEAHAYAVEASVRLEEAQTNDWLRVIAGLHRVRLARRAGYAIDDMPALRMEAREPLREITPSLFLEAMHSKARDRVARQQFDEARTFWRSMLTVGLELSDDEAESWRTDPTTLPVVTPVAGQVLPWAKLLDAALGLSDCDRVAATADARMSTADWRQCWTRAGQWLDVIQQRFDNYLRDAATVPLLAALPDPPLPAALAKIDSPVSFLDPTYAAPMNGSELTLRDAYGDLARAGDGWTRSTLTPDLMRLTRQYRHARYRTTIARDLAGEPGTPQFDAHAFADELTRGSPSFPQWTSATLRAVCDTCRLVIVGGLLAAVGPNGLAVLRADDSPADAPPWRLWELAGEAARMRLVIAAAGATLELTDDNPLGEVVHYFDTLAGDADAPELRLQLLANVEPAAKSVVHGYERALSALHGRAENDRYEHVLNRLTLLEGLRDLGWALRHRKRVVIQTLRTNTTAVEELFADLDRLNNPGLTAWVKRSFFPHWDDVRQVLKTIRDGVRQLTEIVSQERPGEGEL